MTAADEYQRVLRGQLEGWWRCPHTNFMGMDLDMTCRRCELEIEEVATHLAQDLAADPGVRAAVVQWFVEYVATQCAYNGAADPGQRFYDEGLNQWLQQAAYDYSRQEPTDG